MVTRDAILFALGQNWTSDFARDVAERLPNPTGTSEVWADSFREILQETTDDRGTRGNVPARIEDTVQVAKHF